jgi:hypothetical protein
MKRCGRQAPVGPQDGTRQGGEGCAHPRVGLMVREAWRRRLDGVPRQRRSPVAGAGGDEVLQLEEGMRDVGDHLAEENGARRSSSPCGGNGSGGGSK